MEDCKGSAFSPSIKLTMDSVSQNVVTATNFHHSKETWNHGGESYQWLLVMLC